MTFERRCAWLLAALPAVSGCLSFSWFPPPSFTPAHLSVVIDKTGVIGVPISFFVSHSPDCTFDFVTVVQTCMPPEPLARVTSAECLIDGCVVEAVSPAPNSAFLVTVRSSKPGAGKLRVTGETQAGKSVSASEDLEFVRATRMVVAGSPWFAGTAGGRHAVFAGTEVQWNVRVYGKNTRGEEPYLRAPVTFEIEGDSVAVAPDPTRMRSSAPFTDEPIVFSAVHGGTARVKLSAAGVTRTIPIRVATVDEVVSGQIRVARPGIVDVEDELLVPGPAPAVLWAGDPGGRMFQQQEAPLDMVGAVYQVALTLADGTLALGGGGLMLSDHPEVCSIETVLRGSALATSWVTVLPRAPGHATIHGQVGKASIVWPIEVIRSPSAPAGER